MNFLKKIFFFFGSLNLEPRFPAAGHRIELINCYKLMVRGAQAVFDSIRVRDTTDDWTRLSDSRKLRKTEKYL